jgi:6-phosphogluconolactonase (cycloisomerase 2 family)
MSSGRIRLRVFSLLSVTAAFALLTFEVPTSLAESRTGDVYALTNQSSGNSVVVFHHDGDGMLTPAGSFATGGNGTGSGLGSQGAVVLSDDSRLLLAVNAGSNSISAFGVSGDQLILLNTVSSRGIRPISVSVRHNLVYVLNAGGPPNISGFTISPSTNELVPLAGSARVLPGGAGADPAQVSFSPDGSVLVVTEKGTNLLDTFTLNDNGIPQPGVSFHSSGMTPFGFAFGHDNVAIVSDAFGGASGGSALSSYEVDDNGNLILVTGALGDTQTAACWVVVPQDGRFAYTSNTGSGTISSYVVSHGGSLALLNPVAASTGSGSAPTDMAVSENSRFLYVLSSGKGTISGFRVLADGSLMPVSSAIGLPAAAVGLAAR